MFEGDLGIIVNYFVPLNMFLKINMFTYSPIKNRVHMSNIMCNFLKNSLYKCELPSSKITNYQPFFLSKQTSDLLIYLAFGTVLMFCNQILKIYPAVTNTEKRSS
jgi:hypothetical protein